MTASQSPLQTILREPTLHFFLIAALIFALYAVTQSNRDNVLEIDQSEIDARVFLQELSSGQEMNDEQRQLIAASYIEEQILVREALAMKLDEDARIHDILAQKMRHVLSGNIIQPSQTELQEFYTANAEQYRSLAKVSTEELVFDSAEPLSAELRAALQSGATAESLLATAAGNVAPLPNVSHVDLANIFAADFADEVFAASIGQWIGPFVSNRGQHWLQIRERVQANVPPLDVIVDRVRLDWIAQEEDIRLQQQIDALWNRYTIIINNAEE